MYLSEISRNVGSMTIQLPYVFTFRVVIDRFMVIAILFIFLTHWEAGFIITEKKRKVGRNANIYN